ncbi:MAG TPA: DUF4178 domain-containing protein, partial [Kofleriaceae bacterium]|nr:DUF4178 domain-containing protein [Kofleriaceae bacterium]
MAYPFTEYLLYRPEVGYRWLVESAGHWTYAAPVPAGEVLADHRVRATYLGRRFKHFQSCRAEVAGIYGELTWKAEIGESVGMHDFVRPPGLLSCEDGGSEVNWSFGRYVDPAELVAATAPAGGAALSLPAASGIAPNQPFRHRGMLRLTAALAVILLACGAAMAMRAPDREIELGWDAPEEAAPGSDGSVIVFSQPFELDGGQNVVIDVSTDLDNDWVYLVFDLVNQETGLVTTADLGIEYYHGYEGGESWSEGSRQARLFLAPLPGGTYVMRVERQFRPGFGTALDIRLRQGVFRRRNFLVSLGALFVLPLGVFIYWVWFEKKRWSESDHAGGDE